MTRVVHSTRHSRARGNDGKLLHCAFKQMPRLACPAVHVQKALLDKPAVAPGILSHLFWDSP
jgi:hypothetical protein